MIKNDLKIQGNKIFIKEKLILSTEAIIKDFLIIGELIVVLLDSDDFKSDQNIFAYGNIVWQISEPTKLHTRNYFTSIYLNKNNELCAYNKNGIEVVINISNGRIEQSELIK